MLVKKGVLLFYTFIFDKWEFRCFAGGMTEKASVPHNNRAPFQFCPAGESSAKAAQRTKRVFNIRRDKTRL
jgi:hypothetical protein